MAGLTPEGLSIKTLNDVIADLGAEAQEIFSDVTPEGEVVNVEENSSLGRIIGVAAPSLSDIWEAIQAVYDAFNPNAADGISLDNLVALGAISRLPETPTRVDLVVKGSPNTIIPANSKVSSSITGKLFTLKNPVELSSVNAIGVDVTPLVISNNTNYSIYYQSGSDSAVTPITVNSGSGATVASILSAISNEIANNHIDLISEVVDDVLVVRSETDYRLFTFTSSANIGFTKVTKLTNATCDEFGAIEQAVNTVDTISTPVLGWDSVINNVPSVPGRLVETDAELRERFRNSKFERAKSNYESITSSVESINGVEFYVLYENDTSSVDSRGLPPHSFLLVVEGGLEAEVALSIWKNKPAGIYSYGNTEVTIEDTNGYPHLVRFSRPVKSDVQIVIDLTKYSNYPADGDDQIKTQIIEYIESLKIGEQLTYSRLYTPINSVSGHQIEGMQIGLVGGTLGTSNIVPSFDGMISVSPGNISII